MLHFIFAYLLRCHHPRHPFPPQDPWFVLAEHLEEVGLEGSLQLLSQLRRDRHTSYF